MRFESVSAVPPMICLPRMIAAIAGPFGRNYSQGAVGGILGELGMKKEQVWKL